MNTKFPVSSNPLLSLNEFIVKSFVYSQILDFGRYVIRIDPKAGCGYFESEIKVGQFKGRLELSNGRLERFQAPGDVLPPQVAIALQRAGYAV